jgi:type IV pilus assembly protein PilV
MKPERSFSTVEGFTLIEIMIAVAIISIGLLALGGLQVSLIRGNALSQRMTAAVSVAEQAVEQIKKTPYANIQSESPTQVTASGLKFTSQVDVTNDTPLTNTKTITVTVTWSDGRKSHTVPLTTVISQ